MAIGKEYSDSNPAPKYTLVGLGTKKSPLRKVYEPVQQVQPQPVQTSAPITRVGMVPSSADISTSDVRMRQIKSRIMTEETPAQTSEEALADYYFAQYKREKAQREKRDAEKEQAEANRRKAEANREAAHAAELQRRKELLRAGAQKRTVAVENTLLAFQLQDVATSYDLNGTDAKLVCQRIERAGLTALPMTWDGEIQKYIAARDEAFGRKVNV